MLSCKWKMYNVLLVITLISICIYFPENGVRVVNKIRDSRATENSAGDTLLFRVTYYYCFVNTVANNGTHIQYNTCAYSGSW